MLFYFTFRVPISDFVNHSCKYDQSALLVNYRKNKSPVDFDVTSRSRAQTPGKRSLAEYFIVKLRFGERERERERESPGVYHRGSGRGPLRAFLVHLEEGLGEDLTHHYIRVAHTREIPGQVKTKILQYWFQSLLVFHFKLWKTQLRKGIFYSERFSTDDLWLEDFGFPAEQSLSFLTFYERNLTWTSWFPRQGGRRGEPGLLSPGSSSCNWRSRAVPQSRALTNSMLK